MLCGVTTLDTPHTQHAVALGGFVRSTLDMEVRELMTPGVVSIVEDASLTQVHRALGASGREALTALGQPRVSHLLVQRHAEALPEGVISELDLIVGPRR